MSKRPVSEISEEARRVGRIQVALAHADSTDREPDALHWWIEQAMKRRESREAERKKGEAA